MAWLRSAEEKLTEPSFRLQPKMAGSLSVECVDGCLLPPPPSYPKASCPPCSYFAFLRFPRNSLVLCLYGSLSHLCDHCFSLVVSLFFFSSPASPASAFSFVYLSLAVVFICFLYSAFPFARLLDCCLCFPVNLYLLCSAGMLLLSGHWLIPSCTLPKEIPRNGGQGRPLDLTFGMLGVSLRTKWAHEVSSLVAVRSAHVITF
jgi:hypothetical protein